MERTAGFPILLAWVAFCTALGVAIATGLTVDDSFGVRVAAAFGGLVVAVAFALAVARLVAPPRAEPVAAAAPRETRPVVAPRPDPIRAEAQAQLDAGRELVTAGSDGREWIAATQRLLEQRAPGAGRYFAALGARSFADERTRLEAHVARLETVIRDFL